ncbi:GNAT family N-acetyltransferase [Arthrobacter sp. SW1]|uniref:GNAT family N-acetyltransferase n=1 Tax=Arthrobacter sp. SW1 TaxID=1920889 RepID=UPI000877E29E|nr:GNAT family N-acetyltransferase [Arthrobacter sp. SW1]OFI37437.1 GNAT family N-acetyltransferase [Arthrobacter sp. SW1]
MGFSEGSADIVLLAWARHLGLDDAAFAHVRFSLPSDGGGVAGGERLVREDPGATAITFVRLFGHSALTGPAWAIDAAADYDDEELSDHSTLLRLSREHGGHGLGTSALLFADDLPLAQPRGEVTVSHGHPEAIQLEGLCPPDDVNEARLTSMGHCFTVMDGPGHDAAPVACAAYAEWEGILADMGVLVRPELRRQHLGTLATSIAAHEALAAGLTLQWRTALDNRGALALARGLGFADGGTVTSVLLR